MDQDTNSILNGILKGAAIGSAIDVIIRIAIIIFIIYVLYRFFKNIASIANDLHTIAGCMEATSENIYEVAVMLENKEKKPSTDQANTGNTSQQRVYK